MAYISQFKYYTNNGVEPTDANFGSYQYVSLFDIENRLLAFYDCKMVFITITSILEGIGE